MAGPLALKVFKPELAANAGKEWRFLNHLRGTGLAPRPYLKLGRLVVMERLRGTLIKDMEPPAVIGHAPAFLQALHQLDTMGIQKQECHRPHKHFWLTPGGIKLLDFERAYFKDRPSNVTQFLNYLEHFMPGIRELGRAYKSNYDLEPVLAFVEKHSQA